MSSSPRQIDWPPVQSDAFVRTVCLFAEHLTAEELAGGLLSRIVVHGRPLLAHLERLILADRIADPEQRATVVAALGWAGQASSTTAVRAALDDASPLVTRAAAMAAWANLRQPSLAPRLLELASRPDCPPDVAVAAAESLARFGAQPALPAMARLALGRAGLTEEEAERLLAAIERLAGVRFGEPESLTLRQRVSRLRNWWRQKSAAEGPAR